MTFISHCCLPLPIPVNQISPRYLLKKKGVWRGLCALNSDHNCTESIFHVLARLQPQNACGTFKELRDNGLIQFYHITGYNLSYIAHAIAKSTSEKDEMNDNSFQKELKTYFHEQRLEMERLVRMFNQSPWKNWFKPWNRYTFPRKGSYGMGHQICEKESPVGDRCYERAYGGRTGNGLTSQENLYKRV